MSFFFSSRRRHTRWPRDWSSDVCSSDLGTLAVSHGAEPHVLAVGGIAKVEVLGLVPAAEADSIGPSRNRSEERRVGKECRFWWSGDHEKKRREKAAVVAV